MKIDINVTLDPMARELCERYLEEKRRDRFMMFGRPSFAAPKPRKAKKKGGGGDEG